MNEVIEHDAQKTSAIAPVTPMQMLSMAVSKGVSTEQLTQLMDLQDRWEKTEARKAFVSALNAFKANPPEIVKNKHVSFTTSRGTTAYDHATLDNVSATIGKALAEHGISHRWEVEQPDGGKIRVTCVLTHSQGHSERVPLQASSDESGGKNSIQGVGSTVTYLQRYTLLAATGMAVKDSDDDARGGKGEHKMADSQIADFKLAIEDLPDLTAWETLWAQILEASTKTGDVETHEELRGLMAAKRKKLK